MALTSKSYTLLIGVGICSFILQDLVVEGAPGDSAIQGQDSSYFFYQKPEYPKDCKEVRDSCLSSISNGVYLIKPDGYEEPFEAYCDNEFDSGGWTVILRRSDGSIDFGRQWDDYKNGFGFLSTEFWLGNDKLSYLTNQALYELHISITLKNGTSCDLKYNEFRISDEWSDYKVSTLGEYESDTDCRWKDDECDIPEGCDPDDISTDFTDCNDVYKAGNTKDGVYYIQPAGWTDPPFQVFCNMSIDGGNWTVIQRRVNGSINFYRNWTEYRNGFGDIQHEFWLGNEKLHYLTKQATYEYRVDLVISSLNSYHNKYTNFRVDNEDNKYRLANVGTRTGTGGYSLYNIDDTPFSTHDQDNDGLSYDCAQGHRSGWWHGASTDSGTYNLCYLFPSGSRYVRCSRANPNGDYNGGNGQNIYAFGGPHYCNQKFIEMKIRRVS